MSPSTTGRPSAGRTPLIVAGLLLISGNVANTIVTMFHPHQADPNDHPAVFAEYAASSTWIGVHYAQYAAALTMLAGFVVLYRALTVIRRPSALDQLTLATTITAAAALTMLQAIDGVALKHAVNAWTGAAAPDKPARFAAAETVRWIEWDTNSYFYTLVGLTLVLAGTAMLRGPAVPRWLGWAALLGGAAFVVTAVPVGYRGFQATPSAMVAVVLLAVTAIGVTVAGVRTPRHTAGPDIDSADAAIVYADHR
jgi:Domain of unknown function (DUF4386)